MNTRIDAAEALLGALFLVVSVLSVAGIALAESSAMMLPLLVPTAVVASVVILTWAWRSLARRGGVARTPARDWAALACIVAAAIALLVPPAEAIVDAGDASVYLAIGGMVAKDHGLHPVDALAASIPADLRQQLFSRDPLPPPLLNYFPGGLQLTDAARIEPNFFHLAPIWMAVLDQVFGPRGGLFVSPLFAVLGMTMVWAIGRRLAGPWTAIASVALLAVNFGELYFGRWPSSEMATQYFGLAAVWLLTVSSDDDLPAVSVAAGLAIGLAAFTRIDALVMTTLPILGWLAIMALADRPGRRARLTSLGVGVMVTIYAAAHMWFFANAYSRRVTDAAVWILTKYPQFGWGSLIAAVVVMAVWLARAYGPWAWLRSAALIFIACAVIAVALISGSRSMHGLLVPLMTRAGLWAMLAGLIALGLRLAPSRAMPLAVVFFCSAFLYGQHRLDIAGMPLALRRSVPVLLPAGCILIAYAFSTLARAGGVLRWVAAAGVIAFCLVYASGSRVLFAASPYGGLFAQVSAVASTLPDNSVTIVDARTPSHLALSLRYGFDRSMLFVSGPADTGSIARVARHLIAQGRKVRLLVPSSREPRSLLPTDFTSLTLHSAAQLSLRFLEFDAGSKSPVASQPLPSHLMDVTRAIETYEVEPESAPAPLPVIINLGPGDFAAAGAGFHPVETMQDVSARWTDGMSQLTVPAMEQTPSPLTLVFVAAGARPAGLAPPHVQVSIAGMFLGSFVADRPGFAEYRLELSRDQTDALCRGGSLLIRSDAFVPARLSASPDIRRLGIAIDRVEVIRTL